MGESVVLTIPQVIEAARNQINKLPAESSHMKALISLNISHNHANILPNDLGVHGRIQALEVRNNVREDRKTKAR